MIFQQACLSVGMPAPSSSSASEFEVIGPPFTTEVFLREPGKWAVVDATPLEDYKVHYTVDGVPQSMEMHRHVVNGTMDKVVEVHSDRSHKVEKKDSPAWTFYYVRWLNAVRRGHQHAQVHRPGACLRQAMARGRMD